MGTQEGKEMEGWALKHEYFSFFRRVIEAIEATHLPYGVSGAIATNYYGEARSTRDIDLIIDLSPSQKGKIEALLKAFKKRGIAFEYTKLDAIIDFMKKEGTLFAHDTKTPFTVDMILKGEEKINEVALRDRKEVELDEIQFWLISPEPLFIAKLMFARERDIKDVTQMLQRSREEIDENLLFNLAEEYNVLAKLKEILRYKNQYEEEQG